MKHYTTIEQSKKLLELGLNPESADMFYSHKTVFYNMMEHRLYIDEDDSWHLHQRSEIAFMDTGNEIPCWSIGALLEIMPTGAHIEKRNNNYACYIVYNKPYEADTLLEVAYSMVVWLLENGFIKKEPKTSSE